MAYEFTVRRRVEFSETDAAGIVHFSNFFRYMESAEHAFYRSLGFSAMLGEYRRPEGFPRVHAECDYFVPLRFEEEVDIQLLVREKRPRVLSYLFRFWKAGKHGRKEVARGSVTVVYVSCGADGTFKAVPMPERLAAKIEVAPQELLEVPS
jgi:YbgC/YbaW family acyl-CoA thioester hydrolase